MIELGRPDQIIGVKLLPDEVIEKPGFKVEPYCFTEENLGADGSVLTLSPGGDTGVWKMAEKCVFFDVVTQGDGWLLKSDPQGKVTVEWIKAGKNLEPMCNTTGITAVLIAGKKGLTVQEVGFPPYREGIEVLIKENDLDGQALHPRFWQLYKFLKKTQSF